MDQKEEVEIRSFFKNQSIFFSANSVCSECIVNLIKG